MGNTTYPFIDHDLYPLVHYALAAQAEKVLRGVYAFLLGLLPVGLCFWYYRTLGQFPQAGVYFIYTDALFFLANGLVLLAVILWLAVKIKSGFLPSIRRRHSGHRSHPSCFCPAPSAFWAFSVFFGHETGGLH